MVRVVLEGCVVLAGVVVVVVVTVLLAEGLDTETEALDEPLREDLEAPAPLELVLPLLELELEVDALDEPELVLELDEPELDFEPVEELDREAPAPAVLAVLPVLAIYYPPFLYFLNGFGYDHQSQS